MKIARARRMAIYLAVTHFGLAQSTVARAAKMTRQQVFSACRAVEDFREDAEIDATLDRLALKLPAPAGTPWSVTWAA